MHAIQQLTNDHPEMARHTGYMSALIVMQRKCWAYYSILLTSEVIWSKRLSTAGTDGFYTYVNPDFFLSLPNDNQRAFLLAHEVGHIVLRHALRRLFFTKRGFHSMRGTERVPLLPLQWNIAGDYVINADLLAHGLEGIDGMLLDKRFNRDALVDEVYLTVLDEMAKEPEREREPAPEGEGEPAPEGDDDSDSDAGDTGDDSDDEDATGNGGDSDEESDDEGDESGAGGDADDDADESDDGTGGQVESESDDMSEENDPQPTDHDGHDSHFDPKYEGTEEEQEEQMHEDEEELKRNIDTALDALDGARDRGEHHRNPSRGFERAGYRHDGNEGRGKPDWNSELADVVTRKGKEGDLNWGRINRRKYATIGAIQPTRKGTLDRIAITCDISGSVSLARRNAFMTHMSVLLDLMQPASGCLVMWTNEYVERADEVFSGSELLDLEAPYGGGTIMRAGVEYLEENGLDADVHLCFTDGDLWDDDDWNALAAAGVIVVLDRQPNFYVSAAIQRCGIRAIVCED